MSFLQDTNQGTFKIDDDNLTDEQVISLINRTIKGEKIPGVTLMPRAPVAATLSKGPVNPDFLPFPMPATPQTFRDIVPQDLAGPALGEIGGQGAALGLATVFPPSAPFLPVTIPLFGALGAATGLTLERLLAGKPVTLKEVGGEATLSLLPEIAETAIRSSRPLKSAGKKIIESTASNKMPLFRGTRAGELLQRNKVFRSLRGTGREIFNAPTKEALGPMFEMVRNSGTPIPTRLLNEHLDLLDSRDISKVLQQINRADAVLNLRYKKLGQIRNVSMLKKYRQLLDPKQIATFDIGELQDLSSALKERMREIGSNAEIENILDDLIDSIDGAIDSAFDSNPALLREARIGWYRAQAAEEWENALMQHSSLPTGRANLRTINFSTFQDQLQKARQGVEGVRRSMVRLNKYMKGVPGASERADRFLDFVRSNFRQIGVSGDSDTVGLARAPFIGAIFRGIGEVMLSDRALKLITDDVVQNEGILNLNTLAIAVNMVRRELVGQKAEPLQQLPQQP
jgi:hypothetical protein